MKESINRQNYEIWFIDYLDNKLNAGELAALKQFLLLNPDLEKELYGLDDAHIPIPTEEFNFKTGLLKELSDLIPTEFASKQEFMVAKIEGDLNKQQEKRFATFLASDPNLEKEFVCFLKTKAIPDYSLVYPAKAELKRGAVYHLYRNAFNYLSGLSAAAVLLIAFLAINNNSLNLFSWELASSEIAYPEYNSKEPIQDRTSFSFIPTAAKYSPKSTESGQKDMQANNAECISKNDVQPTENTVLNDQLALHQLEKANVKKYRIEWENQNQSLKGENKSLPIKRYLANQFREHALNEEVTESDCRKLSVWDFADAGIRGVGKLFRKDLELKKEYNDNGEVVSLAFNSPGLAFTAPVRKNKP